MIRLCLRKLKTMPLRANIQFWAQENIGAQFFVVTLDQLRAEGLLIFDRRGVELGSHTRIVHELSLPKRRLLSVRGYSGLLSCDFQALV